VNQKLTGRRAREHEITHARGARTLEYGGQFAQCMAARHDVVDEADVLAPHKRQRIRRNAERAGNVTAALVGRHAGLGARVAGADRQPGAQRDAEVARQRTRYLERLVEAALDKPARTTRRRSTNWCCN
jgi:hypothetical protein